MESVSLCPPTTTSAPIKRVDWLTIVVLAIMASIFYAATIDRSEYSFILKADEGYSFAAAVKVGEGLTPQKDFSYAYGPLMPYVYAAAFKVFGVSIPVMRAIWAAAYIATIVLFFVIGRELLPTWLAAIAAFNLIGQIHTPLYSYNHVGLVLAVQLQLLIAIRLIRFQLISSYRWLIALTALFTVELFIKFNEAVAVFFFLSLSLALWFQFRDRSLIEEKRRTWEVALKAWSLVVGIPLVIFGLVTLYLNRHLTAEQIYRNFPILPEYHASVGGYHYVWKLLLRPLSLHGLPNLPWRWYSLWYENYYYAICVTFVCGAAAIVGLGVVLLSSSVRQRMTANHWAGVLVGGVSLGLYHEFFLTGNHWSTPMYVGFSSLFVVWIVFLVTQKHPAFTLGWGVCLFLVSFASAAVYLKIATSSFSEYALDLDRARIRSSNDSDAPVISQVVHYLDQNTAPNISLAAFPHDSLLIHLAGRTNIMRDDDYQWMLFPNDKSDQEIVEELESKRVPGILISNFVGIKAGRPVMFGVDYLTRTNNYIRGHYHEAKTFSAGDDGYAVTYFQLDDSAMAKPAQRLEQQP